MSSYSSRTPSSTPSTRGSRAATPRSKSHGPSSFLDYLYLQKTFNYLIGLCILFFIVILTFVLFDVRKKVRSPICNCESNFYYDGQKCVELPEMDGGLYTALWHQVRREIENCSTASQLKECIPQLSQNEEYLAQFIYLSDYYVDTDGNIHSCTVEESIQGYKITSILLFVICIVLAFLSFNGQKSSF